MNQPSKILDTNMTLRTKPPFRADHVGSFLRPKYLLDAREQFFVKKEISAEQLRLVEDKAITEIVNFQQDVGLQSITDGEFRRTYFHIDFLAQLGGVKTDIPVTVLRPDGTEELAPPVIRVIDKADAGCSYVQMDDTNLAYLCDEKMREAARLRGDDPNELPHRYAAFINKVVAYKPAGMTLAMHLCRGNFKSTHAAAGNYEPVAEALLSEMNLDAFFLEYDDERSGDFRPLRYLSKGKIVVLGLVTTKFGEMESKDALKRRIDEAAKYAPLDQLALSPQCGFSSTVHGNNIAVEAQRAKLRLVIETAQEVWS